jgi:hypothetical protein
LPSSRTRTRNCRSSYRIDTLLQSFHGLLLLFQRAYELLPARPAEAKDRLGYAIDRAGEAITEGRDAVQGLRSSAAEGSDLAVAIRQVGEEFAASESNQSIALSVAVEGTPRPVHPLVRDEIYRIPARGGKADRSGACSSRAMRVLSSTRTSSVILNCLSNCRPRHRYVNQRAEPSATATSSRNHHV